MEKFKDGARHVGEFLLIGIFILAAIGEVTTTEPVVQGALGVLFNGSVITWIYATWFVIMALALLASKILALQRLHKFTLMCMYLTTIYTVSLSLAIFGFDGSAVIDDAIIGATAAACWLRWKFKTEYVDWNEFASGETELG
jgi:hypothetical protein